MTEVSASSVSSVTFAFLGTGTMVELLNHVGTVDWDRERLNMPVNTSTSWPVHALRTQQGMPSGPAALRGLTRLNVLLTLATEESLQALIAGRVSGTVILKAGEKCV